jgi:demethylmenaquinone methyltransferase/2-methoxy-6-polyprenyl-1,4-benzoquinol methylase
MSTKTETERTSRVLPAYAEHAAFYDRDTAAYGWCRQRLVDALPLRAGDTVLDVGCGTGLCFPMLLEKIGSGGAIIGLDHAAGMLAVARTKVNVHGWSNITLLEAPAEQAAIPGLADAAIFCAVHDILQSPGALQNVFAHLRPGAWVAAAGGKLPARAFVPLRLLVRGHHAPYISDFGGFDRPWTLLARRLIEFRVTQLGLGTGYLALGRVP